MAFGDFFKNPLKAGLAALFEKGKNRETVLTEIEELLLLADISVEVSQRLIKSLKTKASDHLAKTEWYALLEGELAAIFSGVPDPEFQLPEEKNIVLLIGVNGSGKTTTAAKLAHFFHKQNKKVLLAAADTFRAAGSSQLALWGQRLNLAVVDGGRGADPGSVVFNSLQSLQSKPYDLLIIDTAGRVQTRETLLRELEKITKIIQKVFPNQPAETCLVLDATTGQNALQQAETFNRFSGISGVILAKMDGTAKGGSVVSIVDRMRIPIKFIGVGESENDLLPFSVPEFIRSLIR